MKIVTVVGARPQFIKSAVLSRVFRDHPSIQEILIHTGQHYDHNMSDLFFEEMDIPPPAYHLNISNCSHGAMTGRMLESIEELLAKEKPDWVLVYGDTNSTLAGALAAVKMHLPVAHVEAGLRSFNKYMPEEINRVLTDHCADLLLAPSERAALQLQHEGIERHKIAMVGDIMIDSLIYYADKAQKESKIIEKLGLLSKKYALTTIHRAENTDEPMRLQEIIQGLLLIAKERLVVWPVHPRTKAAMIRYGMLEEVEKNLHMIEPVGYLDMICLERGAEVILTDSGGIQKEAYFFHVPCLILREETEWMELVEQGYHTLVPLNKDTIAKQYHQVLNSQRNWDVTLYGNGNTAQQIVNKLNLETTIELQ